MLVRRENFEMISSQSAIEKGEQIGHLPLYNHCLLHAENGPLIDALAMVRTRYCLIHTFIGSASTVVSTFSISGVTNQPHTCYTLPTVAIPGMIGQMSSIRSVLGARYAWPPLSVRSLTVGLGIARVLVLLI